MATSISDREPQVIDGSPNAAEESVRLTVTGLDENGQMFRETTDLLKSGRERLQIPLQVSARIGYLGIGRNQVLEPRRKVLHATGAGQIGTTGRSRHRASSDPIGAWKLPKRSKVPGNRACRS